MQLSIVLASKLGVPEHYSQRLAHLTLENYRRRPPSYRSSARCHEDGAWDIWPRENSPPWHNFADV